MKYLLLLILPCILFYDCFCKQYRMSITKLEYCKNPDLPYANPLPFDLNIELSNSSKGYAVMSGNLSVPRDIPGHDKSGSFFYGRETSAGIKWTAKMNDINCNSFVTKAIMGSFGIPLKGCILKKGIYIFKDIDIDVIDTAFLAAPTRTYGMYVTKVLTVSKNETLTCWLSHVKLEPLKKIRG